MAAKLKPNTDESSGHVTKEHNVVARREIINNTYSRYSALSAEMAEAMEEHVVPIRDEITKLMRTAKADTGIPIGVFKAHFKLIDMAKEAEASEDENATTIDEIREVFVALQKGGQLDFTVVVDGSNTRDDGDADLGPGGPYGESFKAGRTVALAGGGRDSSPHIEGSVERVAWLVGYDEGIEQRKQNTRDEARV